ncbi:amidohydrolase family protein [Roseisolibacter sp. H3M3-2]|uniref:amidohydrolase family protein n=1 Tax=Roseisolibacter sp. H3M3-2 TaxID=3031323 RepID=UPI0023DBB68E|nr:amidohydrolase family protein [Roseisolibacter sp. H3M3-2]MDF1504381.1 amidohydrolase family protein [Roseisolibacter sp. H3M3-2]
MRRVARRAAALALLALPAAAAAQRRLPVIDMHLHAHALADYGGGMPVCMNREPIVFPAVDPREPITFAREVVRCATPVPSARTDSALLAESLAELRRLNVVRAVTTGTPALVAAWRAAAPDRILPASDFDLSGRRTVDELRRLHAEGRIAAFGEVGPQYDGRRVDDPAYEPYFALAEELDVPVAIHLGEGPAGGAYVLGNSPYRARLTDALQLEEVLIRHPRLRVYVMHFGSPLVDETIALLYSHPQVYVDVAQNNWGFPRAHFYAQLKRLVDAGFEERILWGSDQMIWPRAIEVALETIEQAPFLTARQKRAILYDNAARFLRLTPEQVARDHARARGATP